MYTRMNGSDGEYWRIGWIQSVYAKDFLVQSVITQCYIAQTIIDNVSGNSMYGRFSLLYTANEAAIIQVSCLREG